ncbi:MAG: DUF11 domain-containing protein [Chloroflexi bacterium]|nr:DUF11 domain-containing protein [Chloroflexota bacterium]
MSPRPVSLQSATLSSGARDGTSRIWDASTSHVIRSFPATAGEPNPAVFSADGARVLAGSGLNLPHLWDVLSGAELRTFVGHTAAVTAVALSPDGTKALTGSADGIAILWDANTGARLYTLSGHTQAVTAVAFSPDGTRALTASSDGSIVLWDVASGAQTAAFNQGSPVVSAVYSPDGKHLVSCNASQPSTAYLWEVSSGAVLRTFSDTATTAAMGGVAISRDQALIATSHADGRVRLWQSGLKIAPLYPITPLAVGSELPVTLRSNGFAYFEIETEAGRNLLITLGQGVARQSQQTKRNRDVGRFADPSIGLTEALSVTATIDPTAVRLFARYSSLPSAFEYDYFDQTPVSNLHAEIPIAPTSAGKYYVLVLAPDLPQGSINTSIRADYTTSHVSNISPDRGGNTGSVTVKITGTGFTADTVARLVAPGGALITGEMPVLNNPAEMFFTFNLRGAAPGLYDVQIECPGHPPTSLVDAFEVTLGTGSHLAAQLVAPSAVRGFKYHTLWLEYANVGDANMAASLFIVSTSPTVPVTLRKETPYEPRSVEILGVNFDGPAGVLPPGAMYRIPIYFWADLMGEITFSLKVMMADATPIDWDAVEAGVELGDTPPDLWAATWDNFKAQTGATWADYLRALDDQATYLAGSGSLVYDARELFSSAMSRSVGTYVHRTLAWSVDAYSAARGLSMAFGRTSLDTLDQRFNAGPFGRSWSHNYEYALTWPDQDTAIVTGPGGTARPFGRHLDGSWQAAPGDLGVLEEMMDLTYRLREGDGSAWWFDSLGRLMYLEEPNGNRITLHYSGNRLTGVSHSNGQSFALEYNAQGRIGRLTDHAGRATEYFYDASGEHLLSVVASGGVTTHYSYVPATGGPANHALQTITYPDGTHQYYAYDGRGRLAAQWRDNNTERVEFTYDAQGAVWVKDASNAVSKLDLGALGQPLEVQDPLGNRGRFQYDQAFNLTRLTKPDGGTYVMAYDNQGNPTQATDPLGNIITMGYTPDLNRLDWLRDARGNLTDFIYNSAGNVTAITYPDGRLETFSYDSTGNLVNAANRRGQAVTFSYNALGQITRKVYPDGRTVDYTYDAQGNLLSAADSATGAITMQYDARNFLTRIGYPGGQWFTFEYNDAGLRTRCTSHDGYTLNYYYDAAGRPARLTDGVGAEIIRYAYDSVGRLSKETKGNGTYTTYAYDAASQLLHMVNYAPDGAVQSRFDYTYDINGNRTSMTTLAGTTSYQYDAIGQLVDVTYPNGRHMVYTYDAEGNRVTVSDNGAATAYAVNNMNQYTQVGGATYTYDADGNMTSRTDATGMTTYQYDAENRLVRVVTPVDGTWEYTYDALGNRAVVSHNGAVTRFIHDPTGLMDVAAEYDGSGVLTARYIHGFGLVARVGAAGAPAYYAFDAGGNTRQVTDGSGGIANTYDYDPFGVPLLVNETIPNPFRYVGRLGVMAEANGLQFMRARYYSSQLGRFITVDPIGLLGGDTNLYTYAGNDPINASDPQGTFVFVLALAGAATGGLLNAGFYALGQALGGQSISGWGLAGAFASGALYGGVVGGTGGLASWGTLGSFAGMATWGGITSGFGHLIEHGRGSSLSGLWGSMVAGIATGWIPMKMLGFNGKWGMNMFGKALRNALLGLNKTGKSLYGSLFASMAAGFIWSMATNIVQAIDPNDKLGPAGIGSQRAVPADGELTYTINFENAITATAPVQELVVVDQLDPNLDWTTFQFSDVAYGNQLLSVSNDSLQFSAREFPTPPTITGTTQGPMAVDITASLNPQTRRVEWRLKAIDTATGLPPEDPFAGFLPPEDGAGHGQGHVSFSIRPKPGIAIGTRITNTARIIFDNNNPIATNEVWNTIGDLSQLQFEAGMYEVDEDAGTATVTVRRVGGQLGRVTVNYTTSNGSATAGADYVAAAGTLTFADRDTADKMITITIKDDALAEGNETLFLTLSDPTGGATLGEPKTATLTIADNEALPTGADLALSKVASPVSVTVGSIVTYTLTVANQGPKAATGVILSDPLPAGFSLVSITVSQGACDGGNIITCGLGAINSGATATVVIAVAVTAAGTVTNTATVTGNVSDGDMTNNSAASTTTVNAPPPIAPVVSIGRDGEVLVLSWTHRSQNTSYQLWRGTVPYFTLDDSSVLVASGMPPVPNCVRVELTIVCTDSGAVGNPALNHFYLVRAFNSAGTSADSNRVGVFGFSLMPGSQ